MKKLIFYTTIFALTIFFFDANAQNVALGIEGGLSIPNLSAGGGSQTPLNTGYSSRIGPDFGVYAEFKFSDLFSLQPALQFSSQGGKKDGFQALTNPQGSEPPYLWATYNSTAKLNYLMLPILAKIGFNLGSSSSPWRLYIDGGPFVSYLVYAHQVTSGSSIIYADQAQTEPTSQTPQSFDHDTDISDQTHKGNIGIEANIGLELKVKKGYFFIEGGGNYGFINIQKVAADGNNNTGAGTVDVGYAFLLGK